MVSAIIAWCAWWPRVAMNRDVFTRILMVAVNITDSLTESPLVIYCLSHGRTQDGRTRTIINASTYDLGKVL